MTRAQRKKEHIKLALSTGQNRSTGFDDISFVHQSLPNIALEEINLRTKIGELSLSSPIFINAMTGGGGSATESINRDLAIVAKETGLAIAVGSQMSAIKDPTEKETYQIVRRENPNGVVFGNIGSEATVEQAEEAISMIEANALQIHLNVIQELTMPEGDRDFRDALERIQLITESVNVPVIVKETGFGMSAESVRLLSQAKLGAIDIGGFGGTNFAKIENKRRSRMLSYFDKWGIPTAASIVEAKSVAPHIPILASGGIQNSLDIIKSLALGASGAGMAGYVLKRLQNDGLEKTIHEVREIHEDMKYLLCALGKKSLQDMGSVPMVLTGELYHWLQVRGLNPERFSEIKKSK
ncbi:type 2 isopentenyl-diphosphate Delta-isomerase [Rossellomorea sp. BNER]|uniref:type 2 isopentenyl-diphosphate Delta-isomerase n=1 Tax=Rossellomorea sp. BNER TaxID=2962031 RepID=UPI003AF24301|nr:type 2 isopentenyl-diphosphate Delta-isomerase [Rossellomorea sp. BNER]